MADLKISELPALAGTLLSATDPLALADLSASETKKITAKDLIQAGVALIDDGSIPGVKVSSSIPPGSVGTTELADGSVTAAKLADQSSAVVQAGLPAAGAYVGQMAVNSTDNKAYIWNGSAWDPFKGAGSINSLTYNNAVGPLLIAGTVTDDNVELGVLPKDTTAGALFMAGPTGSAGTVDYRAIVGTDLPTATTTTKGAVVVSGFGLKVDGDRIEIDNAVTATTGYGVVTYNAQGLVTDGRAITGADLPLATNAAPGVVSLGTQFAISAGGALLHANNIAAGSAAKVAYDANGHITQALGLDAADIPSLDASKIASGTFGTARLADHSITAIKLADYATSYIQDTQPAATGNTIGQLWLNPLAQQIRMWDGNVWVPIGVGALSEQNLRFCGLFDASDGKIKILTKFGVDAGFNVGDVIPTATEQLTGAYFVCETAGNGTAVTPSVTYDPGDWCVCLGVAQGWQRVDTLNSGGGGGGSLDSLADVTITTPGAGQVLTYNGTIWVNQLIPSASETAKGIIEIATQAEVDAGTDSTLAVTPLTMATYVATNAPTPADASTTVKGILQLATDAEVKTGTDTLKAIVPKTLADNYIAKNIATLPALP